MKKLILYLTFPFLSFIGWGYLNKENSKGKKTFDNQIPLKASKSLDHISSMPTCIDLDSNTIQVYPAINQVQGIIGFNGLSQDNPIDNIFQVKIDYQINPNSIIYLEYELFGLASQISVTRGINDELSQGGAIIQKNEAWSTQKEMLHPDQLRKGENTIRFTAKQEGGYVYKIKNLRITAENSQRDSDDLLIKQFSTNFLDGSNLYISGYLPKHKNRTLFINNRSITLNSGVFEEIIQISNQNIEIDIKEGDILCEHKVLKAPDKVGSFSFIGIEAPLGNENKKVNKEGDFELKYKGMGIHGDALSLTNYKNISITALRSFDLPPLGPGMINVTSEASGYRLLPHNAFFDGWITLDMKIDSSKLKGLNANNVRSYYFDESNNKWVQLMPDTTNKSTWGLSSRAYTNHFTDFINAIIKTPDMPDAQAYVPTMFSDLKAANPIEGINVIQPPSPNNQGTLNLNYPIEIPKGRMGMQPNISINYSHESNNSWLGVGWNLNTPSITVDTRWGVPRYSTNYETEAYLLNGSELLPMAYSLSLETPRSSKKVFFPRVEGAFDSIVRYGTNPKDYWWEIIDKNGTKHVYGKYVYTGNPQYKSTLKGPDGIAHWAITEVIDIHGNYIRYNYELIEKNELKDDTKPNIKIRNKEQNLYISTIYYTGFLTPNNINTTDAESNNEIDNQMSAKYKIDFSRDSINLRPDVNIDLRYGFQVVTDQRLKRINVSYNDSIIKNYFINYKNGRFSKSLICNIMELNGSNLAINNIGNEKAIQDVLTDLCNGSTELPEAFSNAKIHKFEYSGQDNSVPIFDPNPKTIKGMPETFYTPFASFSKNIKDIFNSNNPNISYNFGNKNNSFFNSLGSSRSTGYGGDLGLYFGFDTKFYLKSNSLNFSGSLGRDNSISQIVLTDIDGDGYKDKLYKGNNGYKYQRFVPDGQNIKLDATVYDLAINNTLGLQRSKNWGTGIQGIFGRSDNSSVHLSYNYTETTSKTEDYFEDVDGDGILDYVTKGDVYFNRANANQGRTFLKSLSDTVFVGNGCNYIVHSGHVNPAIGNYPDDYFDEIDSVGDQGYINFKKVLISHNSVKVWIAPRAGSININSIITLDSINQLSRLNSNFDGIRHIIQHNENLVLIDSILKDTANHTITNSLQIAVNKNDYIFFRLQSRKNRKFDNVIWEPTISYSNDTAVDADNKPTDIFNSNQDFFLNQENNFAFPHTGTVSVQFKVNAPKLSDSLYLKVTGSNGKSYSKKFDSGIPVNFKDAVSWSVTEDDTMKFELVSNSKIQYEAIKSLVQIDYLNIAGDAIDTTSEFERVRIKTVPYINTLGLQLKKGTPFAFNSTGYVSITPRLSITNTGATSNLNHINGIIFFTIKKQGELIKSIQIPVVNGIISTIPTLYINASINESYFFDFHSTDADLSSEIVEITQADVVINSSQIVNAGFNAVWPKALKKFGDLYRNWGQFTYNGSDTIKINSLYLSSALTDSASLNPIGNQVVDTTKKPQDNVKSYLSVGYAENKMKGPFFSMLANFEKGEWSGPFDITHVYKKGLSNDVSNTDAGENEKDSVLSGTNTTITNKGDTKAVIKESISINHTYGFGIGSSLNLPNGTYSKSSTNTVKDYIDLNGDRYPDIIGVETVQYTNPSGGLIATLFDHNGYTHPMVGINKSVTNSFGVSLGGKPLLAKNVGTSSNSNKKSQGGSLNYGNSKKDFSLMDINGDGLPDKVNSSGKVSLNSGYEFLPISDLSFSNFDELNNSFSGSLTTSLPSKKLIDKTESSWTFGVSTNTGTSVSEECFIDINGDGLVDYIKRIDYLLPNPKYKLFLNVGNKLVEYNETFGHKKPPSLSNSNSISGNLSASYGFPIFWGIKIGANLGVNGSLSQNITSEQFIDINNDGFVDFAYMQGEDIYVHYSNLGKTNLIKSVATPTGAQYTFDYELQQSSQDMPNSKWAYSALEVFDGFNGDGVSTSRQEFTYANPYYDRFERSFYGYNQVTAKEINYGTSTVYRSKVEFYHNRNFDFKGLKYNDIVLDGNGKKYVENIKTYLRKDILTGNIVPESASACIPGKYPAINSEETHYYEFDTIKHISTKVVYIHGPKGNVKEYLQYGDINDPNDDYFASINYVDLPNKGIYSLPSKISVFKDSAKTVLLRERLAEYKASNGDLTKIKVNTGNGYDSTLFEFDKFGNLVKQTLPPNKNNQRYWIKYAYDPVEHSYVEKVSNVFGLSSSTKYDYKIGKPIKTTDVSGNSTEYNYDAQGRLLTIRGPKEIEAQMPYTLKFEYWDNAPHQFPLPEGSIWAKTSHYDVMNSKNDIQTVLHCDGLGRVIQTKKSSSVFNSESKQAEQVWVVSGWQNYDKFGRQIESYYPTTMDIGADYKLVYTVKDAVNPTKTFYDAVDRPIKVEEPHPGYISNVNYGFGNDSFGKKRFKTAATDANGNTVLSFKDSRNLQTTSVAPFSTTTSFVYSALGELKTSIDPENIPTQYSYDLKGQQIKRIHPDAGITTKTYDLAGNLISMATQDLINKNLTINYIYDYNRLIQVSYPISPQPDVYYQYGTTGNEAGKLIKVQDQVGIHEMKYGNMGELTSKISTLIFGINSVFTSGTLWEYDSWNRVKNITYPDGERVAYGYNRGGEVTSMVGNTEYVNNIHYDKFGKQVELHYGNGIVTHNTYNPITRRLHNLQSIDPNSKTFQNIHYSYDKVGNITNVVNKSDPKDGLGGPYNYEYSYDNLYRLINANGSALSVSYSQALEYSPSGKINTKNTQGSILNADGKSQLINTNHKYAYVDGNHKVAEIMSSGEKPSTQYSFDWDANGNMTKYKTHFDKKDNIDRTLCWDESNQLSATADENHYAAYMYDASGSRTMKFSGSTTTMLIKGSSAIKMASLDQVTLYPNELITVVDGAYTNHYYIGSQRVASMLGAGFKPTTGLPNDPLQPNTNTIDNRTVDEFADATLQKLALDAQCSGTALNSQSHSYKTPDNWIYSTGYSTQDVYFYHSDHLGSSSFITTNGGYATEHLQYMAYGEDFVHQQNKSTYKTPYTFSAKEKDAETGFSYFGARYYQADLSIWLSVDPLADQAPGWTPYRYGFNNPVKFIDPTGMSEDGYTVNLTTNEVERINDLGGDEVDFFFIVENHENGGLIARGTVMMEKNENSLVQFPETGVNWGRYGTRDRGGDNWASPETAGAFLGLLFDFRRTNPNEMIYYDDISASDGRDIGHTTHRTGNDIDIRYIGARNGANTNSSSANCGTCYNTLFNQQGHPFRADNVSFMERAADWGFNSNYAYPQNFPNTLNRAHFTHRHHLHIGRR